jgi:hypothetical protein
MNKEYDIPGRLKQYFPIFIELLGDNKIDWKKVTKVFSRKVTEWLDKHAKTGQNIRVEASFFNIITASIEGNPIATGHLDFIRRLFEELIECLDEGERKLIVPALYGMLTNIDKKFWNFLGELCVLNNIKKSTNYQLVEIEVPVVSTNPSGAKLDFKFYSPEKRKNIFIEIVNVHLNEVENWSDEKVNNLLHQKIQGKLNLTGIKLNNSFTLIPIFWGQFADLRRINQFYKDSKIAFQSTFAPSCYVSFSYPDGKKVHYFGTIDSIINKTNTNGEK